MSITNEVIQNWPLNRNKFIKKKYIFLDPFVIQFYATKNLE